MAGIHFYPRVTQHILNTLGYACTNYDLSYKTSNGEIIPLKFDRKKGSAIDPSEVWQLQTDGFSLQKKVLIEYPDKLKGDQGVAPVGATVLPCILWSCNETSTAGVIKPNVFKKEKGLEYVFEYSFKPGMIAGDISFTMVLYLAQPAQEVLPKEEHLMNEPGAILGNLEDPVSFDFDGKYKQFPISSFEEEGGPLWRLEIENWEDPTEDPFSEASFLLLLNTKHRDCPTLGDDQKIINQPLLQEILCEAYFLLLETIKESYGDTGWDNLKTGTDLEPDSICSHLHWFTQRAEERFDWSSPEGRMQSIKRIIDQAFDGGANG